MDWRVERFDGARHDRSGFRCGEPSLDRYLLHQATQDIRRDVASLFCLVADDSPAVIGYYTLCASSVRFDNLPADLARRLPPYPDVPSVLLGRLAVSLDHQGSRLGARLLGEAVDRSRDLPIAAWCLVADALHDRSSQWYRRFGFVPLEDQPLRLVLPFRRRISPAR